MHNKIKIELKEYYKSQLFTLLFEDDALPPPTPEEEPNWGLSPEEQQRQRDEFERQERERRQRDLTRERREREFFENIPGNPRPAPDGVSPADWHRFPKGINPIPGFGPNDVRYHDLGNGYGQLYVWNGERWVPYGGPQLLPNDRYPGYLPPNQRPVILPPAPGWQYYPDVNGNPVYFQDPNGGWHRYGPNGFEPMPTPPNVPQWVQPRPFPPDGFPNPAYNPPKPPMQTPNPGSTPGAPGTPGDAETPGQQQQPRRRFWQDLFRPNRRNPGPG